MTQAVENLPLDFFGDSTGTRQNWAPCLGSRIRQLPRLLPALRYHGRREHTGYAGKPWRLCSCVGLRYRNGTMKWVACRCYQCRWSKPLVYFIFELRNLIWASGKDAGRL
jgi:hypothetical protein